MARHPGEANRTDWFLREHGRFPTVQELLTIREHRAAEAASMEAFRETFKRSSFGTPSARRLRQSIPDDVAKRVIERAKLLERASNSSAPSHAQAQRFGTPSPAPASPPLP